MSTTLLLPILNEIRGLETVMPNVPLDAFEQVLVLDGGSTDGSLEWCRAHGYDIILQTRPGLRLGLIVAWLQFVLRLGFSPTNA